MNKTMEERNFVCKYCSKRFPCGKSLGGHIRTHITEERNNNKNKNNHNNTNAAECDNLNFDAAIRRKKKRDLWTEAGYGLRENPKKTIRSVHSNATFEQQQQEEVERFCKECGKGFKSLKALCGHMASHSQKQKKLVLDSESDTEETCDVPMSPRRSKRMRFKTPSPGNNQSYYSSTVPLANGSSSMSEVEEEQEEVARCLMLLSRDSSHKAPFALVNESSENNSVVVEAENGNKFVSNNGYDPVENKVLKLKSIDNSDSGYYTYGPQTKMAKSDSRKIANYDSFGQSKDTEYETNGKGWKYESLGYDSTDDSDERSSDTDSFPGKKTSIAKKKLKSKKSKEFECPICYKIFKSGQTLEGHKRSHFVGGSEETSIFINQGLCLIDLNLPAPIDE